MDLLLAKLIITLRLDADIADRYALFSLKNDFESNFHQAVCRSDGLCACCDVRQDCVYPATFSRELAADPAALKRYQKPSVPFVFQIPVLPDLAVKGSELELGLVLIGSATRYVAAYWAALLRLFGQTSLPRNLPFSIVRMESAGCSGFRNLLASEAECHAVGLLTTISLDDLSAMNTLDSKRIPLRICTPLRIARDGTILRNFSFSPFIRTLLRRVSSLAYYYYGSILDIDYKRLSALSDSVLMLEDAFCWEEWRKGRLCGIVGSGVLCGELSDFHPVLLLGEYLQCGKDAAFGLGRYQLER
jgi:hypothetical protein